MDTRRPEQLAVLSTEEDGHECLLSIIGIARFAADLGTVLSFEASRRGKSVEVSPPHAAVLRLNRAIVWNMIIQHHSRAQSAFHPSVLRSDTDVDQRASHC